MKNPFPVAHYTAPAEFCNRSQETQELTGNLVNGRSTVLLSPRRIGKSALIEHVFYHLRKKKWHCIYVDIGHTVSLNGLTTALGSAVLNALPKQKSLWNQFMDFLKNFRPGFSANPATGEIKAELYSQSQQEEKQTIQSILTWLDQHENVAVALDEFQVILKYPETGTEAWLRSHIQQLKNIRFIFAGSHQHLLGAMFNNPKQSFFASTSQVKLKKIGSKEYSAFIQAKLKTHGRQINPEALQHVLDWTQLHTYYVQYVCSKLFETGRQEIDLKTVHQTLENILREKRDTYFVMRDMMTLYQFKLLVAVAKEITLFSPTSAKFIQRHDLRSGPSVLKAIQYLVDTDLVYSDYTEEGKIYYSMSDIFFMQWIRASY